MSGLSRGLRRNTASASAAELTKVGSQAVLFVVLARALDPTPFGQLVGALALLQLLGPFAWFGAGTLLVRSVATDERPYGAALSRALVTVTLGATAASLLVIGFGAAFLSEISVFTLALLAASELIFGGVIEVAVMTSWSKERMGVSVLLRASSGLARLVALGAAVAMAGELSLASWAACYAVAGLMSSLLAIGLITRAFGAPSEPVLPTWEDLRTGLVFSAGTGMFAVQDNIDKPLLLRFGFAAEAGFYGIAYRLVILAMLPVRALLQASHARFFALGANGLMATASYARRLLPSAIVYSAVSGLALLLAAPLLPMLLGEGYAETAEVLRWLAPLPLLRTLSYFPGDALTGGGHHAARVRLLAATAVANVVLNVLLIPALSWRGAVVSTFVSDLALAAGLWYYLIAKRRAEFTRSAAEGRADATAGPDALVTR